MPPAASAYLQSLTALAESAQRLAAAVEAGDWPAVDREVPENAACFARLQALPPATVRGLDDDERKRSAELMRQIVAANDSARAKISPRLADMKQLLTELSA